MKRKDATAIIKTFAKYPKIFVDLMMAIELNLLPAEDESPAKKGLVMMLSFIVFGFMPILVYVIAAAANDVSSPATLFLISCIVTAVFLLVLGLIKAKMTSGNPYKSAATTLINGAISAAVSYGIGAALGSAGLKEVGA
jgi:VIT1/CCC1 family predicted Fe2+/Mn2+ transporter